MTIDCIAITSYFNPASFQRRLQNYKIFRERLGIPLVAVEMSPTGDFELSPPDADVLVQVSGGACLWQKERLLNIGLQHVPDAKYVVWIDCDVIFENEGWFGELPEALESSPLVQCYSESVYLPDCNEPERVGREIQTDGYSIAHQILSGSWRQTDFVPSTSEESRRFRCGFAWAARREFIVRHGLYDAMIVGGGDRAVAYAALGRFDEEIAAVRMSRKRAEHYMKWAAPFHNDVSGTIGVLPGRLLHLWHGDIEDRQYLERHLALAELNFDPERDLARSLLGAWEWSSAAPADLREFVEGYFPSRFEDGRTLDLWNARNAAE